MKNKLTILAGIFGNALEWYDFTIYAFFAPLLAKLFFPTQDPFISLLLTFSVFALGFLVRPAGAIFFGYMGDHFGRKKALVLSIIVMSVPTLLLAFLPAYHQIGLAAPILLTLLRLIQGTAVSGELTTATSYLVEHAPHNKRGLAGSLAMCSATFGIMISSGIATLMTNILPGEQLASFGWRVAFAIGGIAGLIGLAFRIMSPETMLYQQSIDDKDYIRSSVIKHLYELNWKLVLVAIFLTCAMAVGNYFLIAYFNTFLIKYVGLPATQVMAINLFCLAFITILLPLMGSLSDKIGRKLVLGSGIIGLLIFSYPIFWLISQKNIYFAFIGEICFVVVLAPIAGLIPTVLAELFETHNRNTSLSMGYNISLAVFGGTAPLVALSLVEYFNNYFMPAYYIMLMALISFIVLVELKESFQEKLG